MAVASISASRLVDAMESSIVSRNSNPLKNKVVHADIRVQGIEDDSNVPAYDEPSVQLVEQPMPSAEDVETQERAEEMQSWWNNEMKKHMNQPDGYAKVAVLLIKWDDELDELNTRNEAVELEDLFRDRFHYYTKTVELNVRTKPHHQLNSHVSNFIGEHDGPRNLLIVYYTGHGVFHEDKKYLELTACTNPLVCKGFSRDAKVNWNKVEEELRDEEVEGDVLTILDTCYASNLVKKSSSREPKKFELIAACPIDQVTASPGKFSFTRALIDCLKELLNEHKEPISTFRLVQNVNLKKNRSDTPAHVWARNAHTEQHIFLAPLEPKKLDNTRPSNLPRASGGYLTLRFGLRDASLRKEQIEHMTKTLSNAFNKSLIGLRKVEWLDMKAASPLSHFDRVALVMYATTQWKKAINKRKMERESQTRSVDEVVLPDIGEAAPALQKRAWEGEEDGPDAKRMYLEPGQPLSPPVSNSSRG